MAMIFAWARTALSMMVQIVDVILGVVRIRDIANPHEINHNQIYTTAEAAQFLTIDRVEVLRLIHSGELQAKKSGGNYRILGRNILSYLSHKNGKGRSGKSNADDAASQKRDDRSRE